jgi:ABC-2 type transport system ATP-binding protein
MHHGRLVALGSPAELRARAEAAQGRILEVATPRFREAFPLVRRDFPLATLYGRTMHLPTKDLAGDTVRVKALLAQAQLPLERLGECGLSLEETFVHFIRQAEEQDVH